MSTVVSPPLPKPKREIIDRAVIRFAGDSGDGMQITGSQFTNTVALYGNDIRDVSRLSRGNSRACRTLPGVSGFPATFLFRRMFPRRAMRWMCLIAMNPAALKVNVADLKANGILIVNSDSFTENDLRKAQDDRQSAGRPFAR